MSLPDVPRPGFGTFKLQADACTEMVRTALEIGYRHVDTARMYENESAVGEAIAQSDVPREDVTLASKVWHDDLAYDDVIDAVHESRNRLGVDYIDIYYVHWPANTYDSEETIGALSDLAQEGIIDEIGVSNFTPSLLDEAIDIASAPITANQVEVHPGFPQDELRQHCESRDVDVIAYSPIGHGMLLESDPIQEIAERHVVSSARVAISWLLAKDVRPIPKASTWEHAEDNWRAQWLALSESEIEAIDNMDTPGRLGDPDFAPWQ